MKKLNLTFKKVFAVVIVVFLLITFIVSSTAAAFSSYEKDVAEKLYENLNQEYQITEFDENTTEYKILKRLEANIINKKFKNEEFKLHHIDDKLINAYYIGNGNIMLFEGLLQELNTEDQLAGLIAHEMGHAVEEHLTKNLERNMSLSILNLLFNHFTNNDYQQMTNIAQNLIANGYSREQEQESDIYAVDLMLRSGYDPDGLIELMQIFKRKSHNIKLLEFTQTHPIPESRIEYLQKYIAEKKLESFVKNENIEYNKEVDEEKNNKNKDKILKKEPVNDLTKSFNKHKILFSYPKEWIFESEKPLKKEIKFIYNIKADNFSGEVYLEDLSEKSFMQTANKQFVYASIIAEEAGDKIKKQVIDDKKLDIYQLEINRDSKLIIEYFISEKNKQQMLKLRFEINKESQIGQKKLTKQLIKTIKFQ